MSIKGCKVRINLAFEGQKKKRKILQAENSTADEIGGYQFDWNILKDKEQVEKEIKNAEFVKKIEYFFRKEVMLTQDEIEKDHGSNFIERNMNNITQHTKTHKLKKLQNDNDEK